MIYFPPSWSLHEKKKLLLLSFVLCIHVSSQMQQIMHILFFIADMCYVLNLYFVISHSVNINECHMYQKCLWMYFRSVCVRVCVCVRACVCRSLLMSYLAEVLPYNLKSAVTSEVLLFDRGLSYKMCTVCLMDKLCLLLAIYQLFYTHMEYIYNIYM